MYLEKDTAARLFTSEIVYEKVRIRAQAIYMRHLVKNIIRHISSKDFPAARIIEFFIIVQRPEVKFQLPKIKVQRPEFRFQRTEMKF